MSDPVHRFYEIEQQKLLLDFEKIALFTRHPTSLGTFRESRLRQYLREFTPKQLSMGTGFVAVSKNAGVVCDTQSRQIDCLVFDETKRHPDLRTDDYVIVRPEAMYAAIEVKSELTLYKKKGPKSGVSKDFPFRDGDQSYRWEGTLIDSFQNIKSVADNMPLIKKGYFSGVFGYSSNFSLKTLYLALHSGELQKQLNIRHIDELPPAICVPGKYFVNFSPYDFLESSPHHDPYVSFMNTIEAMGNSTAFPLQFFTNFYLNQISYSLTSEQPLGGGLNSSASDAVLITRQHFRLNSEGYEDQ
jgi:hypothetical protein